MTFGKVKLVWLRELRDQMRDRRTLFTVAVLPILLYPLMGMVVLQVLHFRTEQTTRILVIGEDELPPSPPLIINIDGQRSLYGGNADRASEHNGDNAELLELVAAEPGEFAGLSNDEVEAIAKVAIDNGNYDAVIYFPPDFSDQLARYRNRFRNGRSDRGEASEIPKPFVYAKTSKDASRIANERINSAVQEWGATIYAQTLEDIGVEISEFRPIKATTIDVAEEASIRAHLWAKILPFVLMIWALTGAFYPAIDLCAGEKERGTLETLLTSPAQRGELVWGKLLAVTTFSIATALLNLLSLVATGAFVMKSMGGAGAISLGPPPLAAIGWLLVALIPASLMFSALALAIAAMARSSKEGQYYLMPLLLISMPLMIVPIMPGTQLSLGTSLIPITGLIFVLRQLIEGEYVDALRYAAPVIGVTILCVWLSIRWAIDQFNKEEVLFRESEQFSLGIWLRHIVRDRGLTPTLGAALFIAAFLLVLRFFGLFALNSAFPAPQTWEAFTLSTLITLVGLIAIPAVLAAMFLTRSPRETMLLKKAPGLSIVAAFLLALCVHPVLHVLQHWVTFVFPAGPDVALLEEQMQQTFAQAPGMWAIVLLIALAPAVCEELAFRGFILSGLRRMGHKWGAIVLSAALFGIAHGLLQQSVMATLTGIVLGYIAVQTGSLWPCIVYHFTNNASVLLVSSVDQNLIDAWPVLNYFFVPVEGGYAFAWWVAAAGAALALAILYWFARLPHRASQEEQLQQALDHQQASVGA